MTFEIHATSAEPAKHAADLLALIVNEGAASADKEGKSPPQVNDARLAAADLALAGLVAGVAADEEFTGKDSQTLLLHTHGKLGAARLAVLGVGKPRDAEKDRDLLRVAAARALRAARSAGAKALAIAWPWPDAAADLARDAQALAEGVVLASYRFDKYLREKKPLKLARVELLVPPALGSGELAPLREAILLGTQIGEATCLARSLVNEPAAAMTPEALAAAAAELGKRRALEVEVLDPAAIEKLGMRLFLAVAQGSAHPARLVRISYLPAGYKPPKKGKEARSDALALIGKAVCFDSGGLSLKTAGGMEEMKTDMAGAAAVIGALDVIAALKPPFPVHGYFGACENMPSGTAVKPGDVVTGKSGTSVEILNTDAEGRLVLADVLAWACEEKPAAVIDLATLTGACVVALGPFVAGLFSNDDALAGELQSAARGAGEELWRMPLPPQMEEFIKSPIADLKNIGGRFGGAITAGLFLQHFVGRTPWAHLDIAGPASVDRERGVHPRGGTGMGVRTLVELVRRRMAGHSSSGK